MAIPATKPSTCSDDTFSDAWTMVADSNAAYYAQIGFGMDYLSSTGIPRSSVVRYIGFTQFTKANGNPYTQVYSGPPLGTTRTFTNVYRSTTNHIHMLENGVQYSETGYDPIGVWADAWQGQMYNEAGHLADSSWGKPTDKLVFTETQRYKNGSWQYFLNLNNNNDNPAYWSVSQFSPASGGTGLKVWDQ